jgi:alpha-tubulin suppressor-like RCC1 family protein
MALGLGEGFTLALTENGNICGFGKNYHGQLGTRTEAEMEMGPITLEPWHDFARTEPVMLAAADGHAACVTHDGSVWTWGEPYYVGFNNTGGVGPTDATNMLQAPWRHGTREFGRSNAVMVACGMHFTVVLTAAGQVWNCGLGRNGELGHGDKLNKPTMTLLDPVWFGGRSISLIAAGYLHTMALASDGNLLYTWGPDQSNMRTLGRIGTPQEEAVPGLVQNTTFGGAAVASMDASLTMSSVVTVDGVLWSCGTNYQHALGVPGNDNQSFFVRVGGAEMFGGAAVRHVACGYYICVILAENGRVWRTGAGGHVVGNVDDLVRPLANGFGFHNSGVAAVACGFSHYALVKENGVMYTWGNGYNGNLCHGDREGLLIPQSVSMNQLGRQRVGRWHGPDPSRALAFGMVSHERLGNGHGMNFGNVPSELVRLMFQGIVIVPHPQAGPGLRTLMGFQPLAVAVTDDEVAE